MSKDNIATRHQPVMRLRIVTPLTPRAVREQLVADALESGRTHRYIARRLTPLDRQLSDDEAYALERYAAVEAAALSPPAGQYDLARVECAFGNRVHLSEYWRRELAVQAAIKRRMPAELRPVASQFVLQMNSAAEAPTYDEAATILGLGNAQAYIAAVVALGRYLAGAYLHTTTNLNV